MAEKITYNIELEDGSQKEEELDLNKIKETVYASFNENKTSNNAKQKLVYNLLNAIKNQDQNSFFWILLKQINSPEFSGLAKRLEKDYQFLPEKIFINYAYSIILGIMATYSEQDKQEGDNKNE